MIKDIPEPTMEPDHQVPTGIAWDRKDGMVRGRVMVETDGNRQLIATVYYTDEQAAAVCSQMLKAMRS